MRTPLARRTLVAAALAAMAAATLARPVGAQTVCADPGLFTFTAIPGSISYGPVSLADLENGQIVMGSVSLTILPLNVLSPGWKLCIRGNESSFGAGGKPIEDIEWQLVGTTGWQAASTAEQLVTSGSGLASLQVMFRVIIAYEDAIGDYDTVLTFIASGP